MFGEGKPGWEENVIIIKKLNIRNKNKGAHENLSKNQAQCLGNSASEVK